MSPPAPPSLTLLTGASRGLGLALAQQLLAQGHDLLTLSRQTSPELQAQAQALGRRLWQWSVDLMDPWPVAQRLQAWLAEQPLPSAATLINNAGVLADIAPLGELSGGSVAQGLRVGLEAPMALTHVFLAATGSWAVPRRVLNISSGLGRRAMASQATYCAAKAGMDHFSQCVALEQAARAASGKPAARICSLAPGVIATEMQRQLREADANRFADRPAFEAMHLQGQLSTPELAAQRVLAWLARDDFGDVVVADVRQA